MPMIKRLKQAFLDCGNFAFSRRRIGPNVLLEEQKAIYVPIPKVGCTTISTVCAKILQIDIGNASVHKAYLPCAGDIKKSRYRNHFKFAFVRNPWDRLVSCYVDKVRPDRTFTNEWFKNGVGRGLHSLRLFHAGMSFEEFVAAVEEIPDARADRHFRSQHRFLYDDEEVCIVDYIGRFEDFDMDPIFRGMNIPAINVPHKQRSTSKKASAEYYTDDLRERVAVRYAKDITLFGYGEEAAGS